MTPPQVLLIGDQSVDKHGLMCRLVGQSLSPDQSSAPWRIDNKYYSADVELRIAHLGSSGPAQDLEGTEEGVVMVFNAGRHDTFASLRQWWEGQASDPAIKLAVATRAAQQPLPAGAEAAGDSGEPAQWLQDAQEWCAEQLIEYVEVPEEGPGSEHAGRRQGLAEAEEGGEAEGLQRVMEALHAHMWPGLRLKPRGKDNAEAQSCAPSSSSAGPAAEAPAAVASDLQLPAQNGAAPAANGLPNYLDMGEEQQEELDMLFAELAGARERLQGMGDSERRDAAAALMLRLMGALGLDEDGDDSEGEEGQEGGHAGRAH